MPALPSHATHATRWSLAAIVILVLLALTGGMAVTAEDPEDPVTVAVVDTGIDDSHPALEGRVVDRIDLTDDSDDALDSHGHGTHVAGVLTETAPNADLIDVRVLREDGDGDADRIARGIEHATDADADIILLSLNTPGLEPERIDEAARAAHDQDILVVASAGNRGPSGEITTPGTTPEMLTVGATDENGSVLAQSSRGPTGAGHLKPELVAPGERIVGPEAGGDGTFRQTGTSVAAPQVAGAGALLLEVDPSLQSEEIKARLTATARPVEGATAFDAGSGELDVERTLEPDVLPSDGVIDFGLVDHDDPLRKTITFDNHDDQSHELSFETHLENVDDETVATMSTNRSSVTLEPGETTDVELVIANATGGAHAGALEYAVNNESRSVAVGFVRGGEVTIEKVPYSADGSVDGNDLLVFSADGTYSEFAEIDGTTASFIAGSGTYHVWSMGMDEETDSQIFTAKPVTVTGDKHVTLDERETVPVGVDASPIVEEYGPLENRTMVLTMTMPTGNEVTQMSRVLLDADNRTARVSPERSVTLTTTYLLATQDTDSAETDLFQLHTTVRNPAVEPPRAVSPSELRTTTYRFHRTTDDRRPEVQDRALLRSALNTRALNWADVDHDIQRVHRQPGANFERHLRGEDADAVITEPAGGRETVDVLSHPFLASIDLEVTDDDARIEGRPLDDGAGTAYDADAEHTLSVSLDGERYQETQDADHELGLERLNVTDAETLEVSLRGSNNDSRLSTATHTDLLLEGDAITNPRAPLVRSLSIDDLDTTNAAGPGDVTAMIEADELRTVSNPRVWYTVNDPDSPPWADDSAWTAAETSRSDGALTAAFNLEDAEAEETVTLALELETTRGERVRTMTTDGFYVGSAPNTSTRLIDGRLMTENGTPATNDTVLATGINDGETTISQTDDDGRFELEVPKDERYDLEYRHGEPWTLSVGEPGTDRPALFDLGTVTVGDKDKAVERTLPPPGRFTVNVTDERGTPVADASVTLQHRAENGSATIGLSTAEDGQLWLNESAPGLELAGEIELTVEPPTDRPYREGTHQRNVTVDAENHTETVTVETTPPSAALESNRGRMLEGTPVRLDAGESAVPAGADEYRWDLSGNGTVDQVTEEPTIRYEADRGITEPEVTVVDEAGKTDTATTRIQVEPVG